MLCKITYNDGERCVANLRASVGVSNAIRRSLRDIESIAPAMLTIRENTSAIPDEQLSHRIGMIPFKNSVSAAQSGEQIEHGKLKVQGRDIRAIDIAGSMTPVADFLLLRMNCNQSVDCEIQFEKGTADMHAKYDVAAGVAHTENSDGTYDISFESVSGEDPAFILLCALGRLKQRLVSLLERLEQSQKQNCSLFTTKAS